MAVYFVKYLALKKKFNAMQENSERIEQKKKTKIISNEIEQDDELE